MILPTFQPQNPAKSGCPLGWASCTSFSSAMAAAYEKQVHYLMSGCAVRARTGDTTGGTNLAQNDAALNNGWHIDLAVHYRMPWATFARLIDQGAGGVLQGWYAYIADYDHGHFDAGNGFRGNHALFVPSGWGAMEPLADGRFPSVYRYHGEAYPQTMLRHFAGGLNISGGSTYTPLGDGYVYAMMTHDRVNDYSAVFDGGSFWTYVLGSDGKHAGRKSQSFSGPTSAPCTPPKWVPGGSSDPPPSGYKDSGDTGKSMVLVTAGALRGQWVAVPQANVHAEVQS